MIRTPSLQARSRSPVAQHSTPLGELASRRVVRAASQGTPDQLPDPAVLTALEHYGALAKAAYIMFDNNTAHDADIKGRKMSDVVASDEPGLDVLAGYTGVSVISGFPGSLFAEEPLPVIAAAGAKRAKAKPSVLGFIAEGAGADGTPELVIAFRGSAGPLGNWMSNLLRLADAVPYAREQPGVNSKGRVHRGFSGLLRSRLGPLAPIEAIENVLAAKIAASQAPPRIVTTGHGLGGALAILVAANTAAKHTQYQQSNDDYTQRLLQSYTFAAPRVGDATLCNYFADQLQYKAVQMKNKQDAVPHAAPGAWGEVPGTIEKALGMPAATPAEGSYHSQEQERLRSYQKLAAVFPSMQELATACDNPDALSAAMDLPQSGPVNELTGVREDLEAVQDDAGVLLHMLSTSWSDNPGAPFFVFDADEAGKWGGRKHSLEVYLKHIKNCNTEGP